MDLGRAHVHIVLPAKKLPKFLPSQQVPAATHLPSQPKRGDNLSHGHPVVSPLERTALRAASCNDLKHEAREGVTLPALFFFPGPRCCLPARSVLDARRRRNVLDARRRRNALSIRHEVRISPGLLRLSLARLCKLRVSCFLRNHHWSARCYLRGRKL